MQETSCRRPCVDEVPTRYSEVGAGNVFRVSEVNFWSSAGLLTPSRAPYSTVRGESGGLYAVQTSFQSISTSQILPFSILERASFQALP